jgi:hypothetical protein
MFMRHLVLAAAAASALAAVAQPSDAGDGNRLIRRCTANGSGDISMSARYEVRSGYRRFDVEFEARPSTTFAAGRRVAFVVGGITVGRDRLATVVGGDVVGEINLDSRGREPGDDRRPFPANFPSIKRGSKVTVLVAGKAVLGCRLS